MATQTAVDVVMPQMGVSVSEGTITKWLKQPGETIAADESLLEISTDKVDTEVPSPATGVLQKILVQEGETVEVGTVLAVIGPEGSEAAPAEAPAPEAGASEAPAAEAPPAAEPEAEAAPPEAPDTAPEVAPAAGHRDSGCCRRSVRGRREGVRLPGGGAHRGRAQRGRRPGVRHRPRRSRDQEGHPRLHRFRRRSRCRTRGSGRSARAPAAPAARPAAPRSSAAQPAPAAQEGETSETMSPMRKGIAEHMRRSLDTSAHVTSAIEVDMSKIVAIRGKLKKEYTDAYGVNPTYLAFVARATVDTIKDYPWVNSEMRGDQIITRPWVNLGFAVELADGKGLIVPVVKSAETLNLLGMAKAIADIAKRARDKQLLPDDVAGGTFTITNPGGYGTFHGTPVISQPQAAILGTYAVVKRAWVVQDEMGQDVLAIRPIMNITLTYDHRIVDGALAGRFLRDLKERLENSDESAY